MARQARIVVPGEAHLVTQRGNRSMQVFFNADDSNAYKALLAEHCKKAEVEVLAWPPLAGAFSFLCHDGTTDAAIALFLFQQYAASLAIIKPLTGIGWPHFGRVIVDCNLIIPTVFAKL